MSVIHAPRKPELDLRVAVFPVVMVALLAFLLLRLWYIQVVMAPELQLKAEASRATSVKKLAPRGMMVDRNGTLVAGVRPEIVITAKPGMFRKDQSILDRAAAMLGADPKKIKRKVKDSSFRPFVAATIYVGADIETGTRIAESGEDLPGIGVETQPMRTYPDSRSFTHVLGYVWTPSKSDVERVEKLGLNAAGYVGKAGLERAYEADLMGKPGEEKIEIDARSKPVRVAARDAAVPGNQLVLTLDARLQKYATQLFADKKYIGGAVALDPKTGEVLCIVSSPTFDQNLFAGGITDQEWRTLSEDELKPMWNRALFSAYSPGSTFKIVTTIAALQKGIFDPNRTYFCAGGVRLGRRFAKCLGHHGAISYHRALAKSCNSYFYQLGLAVGEDGLRKAALDVGLGQRTGLEVGGESKGIVPTDEWIKKWRPGDSWHGGDTLNFAIGQGFLSTTPIQMANVVALAANDGVNYRPHLVRRVMDSRGQEVIRRVEPEVLHQIDASPEFWGHVKGALVQVIEDGTAGTARIPGLRWGGKTGSTEHGGGKKTHAWFVGFAPAENPKIAICVLIEEAGHGGDVAAPVAREIVKRYFELSKTASKPAASASVAVAPAPSPRSR
ncbi:MAG: penicillin-binding protein 2 [Fimbriimonas sp.]